MWHTGSGFRPVRMQYARRLRRACRRAKLRLKNDRTSAPPEDSFDCRVHRIAHPGRLTITGVQCHVFHRIHHSLAHSLCAKASACRPLRTTEGGSLTFSRQVAAEASFPDNPGSAWSCRHNPCALSTGCQTMVQPVRNTCRCLRSIPSATDLAWGILKHARACCSSPGRRASS
jgi:hypothetical protein